MYYIYDYINHLKPNCHHNLMDAPSICKYWAGRKIGIFLFSFMIFLVRIW